MNPVNELGPAPATAAGRSEHVNDVVLVGELAGPAEERTLPSGEEVQSFRLSVRTPSSGAGRAGHVGDPARLRADSVDCVAVRTAVRARLARYGPGDVVRVEGSLRHRYWRGAGGINSRYEVEADVIKLVKRRPPP